MWWNLLCIVIAPLCLKVLSQILQVKAMSYCFLFLVVGSDNSWHFFLALSLFLLKCFFITSFLWNTIPQSATAQLKFNFVWTEFTCLLSSPICVKSWSHWSQWCEVNLSWLFYGPRLEYFWRLKFFAADNTCIFFWRMSNFEHACGVKMMKDD